MKEKELERAYSQVRVDIIAFVLLLCVVQQLVISRQQQTTTATTTTYINTHVRIQMDIRATWKWAVERVRISHQTMVVVVVGFLTVCNAVPEVLEAVLVARMYLYYTAVVKCSDQKELSGMAVSG